MKQFDFNELSTPAPGLYVTRIYISTIFKDLFLLNNLANQIKYKNEFLLKAKFYVEPPSEGGKKEYINGPSHKTKTVATSYMEKTLQESFPTELMVQ